MAPFDPYHKWLGIPPEDQPPNHYRLLAIPLLEADADVIETAAERQTLLLRTFQTGPNSELAERLLNEVSEARVCLLTAEDKAEYDQRVQSTSEPSQPVVAEEPPATEKDWSFATVKLPDDKDRRLVEPEQLDPLDQGPLGYSPDELVPTADQTTSHGRTPEKQEKPFWQEPWAFPATAGGIVVLLLLMIWLTSGGDPSPPDDKQNDPVVDRSSTTETEAPSAAIAPSERQSGWKLLFDGKTTKGWRNYQANKISSGWKVIEGALTQVDKGAGDIVTEDQYDSFELSLEYKVAKGAKSGLLYHVMESESFAGHSGPEVQIQDNINNRGSKTGWLIELYSTDLDTTLPAGEWNELRIRITPELCEHSVNGVKYFSYVKGGNEWNNKVANSKFAKFRGFGKAKRGHIALQDQGGQVSFRKIKIRELTPLTEPSTKSVSPPPAIAPFDATQAKQHQQQWATHLETPVDITNSIGMKLKLIPPGEFMRGYTGHALSHEVKITNSFYMGTHEVTQAQYEEVMGGNPSNFKGPQNPVETVSWNDAVEFCRKLSAMPAEKSAGRLYRLPTDAQWEYTCRAGTTTKYSFGDEVQRLGEYAWYLDNSGTKVIDVAALLKSNKEGTPEWRKAFAKLIKGNDCRTHPIGRKQANPWGLYDVYGNVWEWCQDWAGAYPSGLVSDPLGPASGTGRTERGGSWANYPRESADRGSVSPSHRGETLGFRIAMSPTAAAEKLAAEEAIAQTVRTLVGHEDRVQCVAFSPDGKRIVSASADHTLIVWNADTDQKLLTLAGHAKGVQCVAFSPDGNRIASGSLDKTVKLWDAETGNEMRTLTEHGNVVQGVAFSPDGKRLVSGSSDKMVRVWFDLDSGREVLTLEGHTHEVRGVVVSPDGKRIVSSSADKTLKVWNTENGLEVRTLKGHKGFVFCGAFSPDGKRIVSGSHDKTLKVWDTASGQETLTLKGHSGPILSVAFSADGKRIVSAGGDKTLKVWDTRTGQETLTLKGHTDSSRFVAFSPDGKLIASGSIDTTVKVWDISSLAP